MVDVVTPVRRFQEKHIWSALLGACTISVLCSSLAEPVWFEIHLNDVCCYNYIGLTPFMHHQPWDGHLIRPQGEVCHIVGPKTDIQYYSQCIDQGSATTIQILAAVMIMTIFFSVATFALDVIAPRKSNFWKVVKRYAFGYIFTVILVATALGFAYWSSEEIKQHIYSLKPEIQNRTTRHIKVDFGMGVYLTLAGGCLAVLAIASNLMRQYPTPWEEQAEELALMSDEENDECGGSDAACEPPAYAP